MNTRSGFLRNSLAVLGLSLAAAGPALAASATLTATDHASWAVEANGYYQDNLLRSYYSSGGCNFNYCGPFHVDSFLKFDLGSIPDGALITGASFSAHVTFNSNSPPSEVYESFFDLWSDASGGPSVTHDSLLGSITAGGNGWNTWNLNAGAASWATHLADNTLTLAFHNPLTSYSFLYFDGADVAATAPYLTLTYETAPPVPEPEIYALMLAGLGLLASRYRRRAKR